MSRTSKSFKNKWGKNTKLAFDQTLDEKSDIFQWIFRRNNWKSKQALVGLLKNKKRILDAGCGNGRVTALLRECSNSNQTEIVGIDIVSHKVAKNNLKGSTNVSFYQKDLLKNLNDLGKFDFIYCQEVLHHTTNPKKAFLNLSTLLNKKGEIAIYVYKKKAPVREFVDDYIRNIINSYPYPKAMKVCDQITALGEVLAKNKIKIKIPNIDVLEIKEGTYDLQRFVYHFFMKCFWNNDFSFHENSVINYDWYHPQQCSRHTLKEVTTWFRLAKLQIIHTYVDEYGITMRGTKK